VVRVLQRGRHFHSGHVGFRGMGKWAEAVGLGSDEAARQPSLCPSPSITIMGGRIGRFGGDEVDMSWQGYGDEAGRI
jgi:hypothetical protein